MKKYLRVFKMKILEYMEQQKQLETGEDAIILS